MKQRLKNNMDIEKVFDCHAHVLPGVDDGAQSIEQALNMLRIAESEGIRHMVATPHLVLDGTQDAFLQNVTSAYHKLCQTAEDEGIRVSLYLGFETAISDSLLHESHLFAYAMCGSPWLLVEEYASNSDDTLEELLYTLKHQGLKMILAHPERSPWFAHDLKKLERLAQDGVKIQVNTGSIVGMFGPRVQKTVKKMAGKGLISLLGTDAHSDGGRAPYVKEAVSMLSHWVGAEQASYIAEKNAMNIFVNKE